MIETGTSTISACTPPRCLLLYSVETQQIATAITVNDEGTLYVNAQNSSSLTAIDPATFKRSEVMKLQIGPGSYGEGQIAGLAVGKGDRVYMLASELGYAGIHGVFAWDSQTGIKRVPWNDTAGEDPTSIATDVTGDLSLAGYDGIFRYGPALPDHLVASTSVPDRSGETVSLYDAYGRHRETRSTRTNGLLKSFEYSGGHRLKAIIDGFGNRTTIERDSQGDPTAIVAPFGQRTELTVGAGHLLSSVVKPGGAETSITYDTDGLMKTYRRPNGGVSQFTYSSDGRLIRDEDPLGGTLELAASGSGEDRSVEVSNARGRIKSARVERLPDRTVRRTIDSASRGRSTRTVTPEGSVTIESPRGSGTATTTPDARFGAGVRAPADQSVISPRGRTTSAHSSVAFDMSNWADPNSWHTQTLQTSVNGQTWKARYEKSSNRVIQSSPEGRQNSIEFNEQMLPIAQDSPGIARTEIEYDSRGRVKSIASGQRSSELHYDLRGNIDETRDPLGRIVRYSYDADDRVTTAELPGGRTVGYGYDADGNLTSVTPPSRPAHQNLFDVLGQVTSISPPEVNGDTGSARFEYGGADHQLTTLTRASGRQAHFSYDDAGRPVAVNTNEGTSTTDYDPDSGVATRLVSETGQATEISVDGSLVTGLTQAGTTSGTVSMDYDQSFRPSRISTPGSDFDYTYDSDSLATSVGAMSMSRNSFTGLVSHTSLGESSSTISFNSHAEANSIENNYANGGVFNETYTRDRLGRVSGKSVETQDSTDIYDYTYDSAGRLTEVELNGAPSESYSYDANSNRTSVTLGSGPDAVNQVATVDGRDRMTSLGGLELDYSVDGEMTAKHDTSSGQTTDFSYGTLGDLRGATLPDGRRVTYVSDGYGNRVAKKVDGQFKQGFLYAPDMGSPVAELGEDGEVDASFAYGTDPNVPDYMVRGGHTYRLISDQVGSVRMVVDAESGSVEQEIDYDSFGRIKSDSNPGFQPFGFAGGLYDNDTKLTHLGAREYDAQLGRWTSSDPIGFASGDTNLYGYVLQDPVNMVDPSGLYGLGDLWSDVKGTVNEIPNSFATGATLDYFLNYSAGVYHSATLGLADSLIGLDPDCMGQGFGFGEVAGSLIPLGGGIKLGGAIKSGREYKFGKNFRAAPFGNRGKGRFNYPHYHRRRPDTNNPGEGLPDQGMKRHRPWDTKQTDKGSRDRW